MEAYGRARDLPSRLPCDAKIRYDTQIALPLFRASIYFHVFKNAQTHAEHDRG